MNVTFDSLDDAAVSQDPLVVLSCGHAFCTSTLDGHMEMSSLYREELSAGGADAGTAADADADPLRKWVQALPRDDFPTPKGCPVCRQPIHGVYRYGRLLGLSAAGLMERKHVDACR